MSLHSLPPATPSPPGSPPRYREPLHENHTCCDPDYDELVCAECEAEIAHEDEIIAAKVSEWARQFKCNILLRRKKFGWKKVLGKGPRFGVDIREFSTGQKHPLLDCSERDAGSVIMGIRMLKPSKHVKPETDVIVID